MGNWTGDVTLACLGLAIVLNATVLIAFVVSRARGNHLAEPEDLIRYYKALDNPDQIKLLRQIAELLKEEYAPEIAAKGIKP